MSHGSVITLLLTLAVGYSSISKSTLPYPSETMVIAPTAEGYNVASPQSTIFVSQIVTQARVSESVLLQKAKQIFNRYVALESAFNVAALDLYAENALIQNTRRYPNSRTRVFKFSLAEYKDLVNRVLPLARARGDRNQYSQIAYKVEGSRVRITAQRYSLLKKYTSPVSMLVGPDSAGQWKIFEHISESRP